MNLKTIRKGLRVLIGSDPNDTASCALCGSHRRAVRWITEGRDGYVCDACAFVAVGVFGARVPAEELPGRTFDVVATILESVDERTPHAALEPLFEAALVLAEGAPARYRAVAAQAFRLEHYSRAANALDRIDAAARTSADTLGALAAWLTVEDRPAIARGIGELEGADLGELHRIQLDVHRAWAAFRLEASGAPLFTFDGEALRPLLLRLPDLGAPPSLGQALEVAAAYERSRDPDAALRFVDEALAVAGKASRHLLRGDILHDRNPVAARAAWETALERAHPDSVWASRARARLGGVQPHR